MVHFTQESNTMYGELIPLGGGDPIPLLKKQLLIGRRESCDIVLRFGRFPHRNTVLQRSSTPEELKFLEEGPTFGQTA